MKKNQVETPKEFKIKRARDNFNCPICPPNRGENCKRHPKKSWKSKRKTKYKE